MTSFRQIFGGKNTALFSFFKLATKNLHFKKFSSIYKASFELFAYYGMA